MADTINPTLSNVSYTQVSVLTNASFLLVAQNGRVRVAFASSQPADETTAFISLDSKTGDALVRNGSAEDVWVKAIGNAVITFSE